MPVTRTQRVVRPLAAVDPQIGGCLWALDDARLRLELAIAGIDQAALDWQPSTGENTIGTLLYHIALIEADYLYADVMGLDEDAFPVEVHDLFPLPLPDRDSAGRLTVPPPTPLAQHVRRLDAVRGRLLEVFAAMSLEDFHRPRGLTHYDISPAWTLDHLAQHEAEHRGQILTLRERAEEATDRIGGSA